MARALKVRALKPLQRAAPSPDIRKAMAAHPDLFAAPHPERRLAGMYGAFASTDLPALKSEIQTDPTGIGYAPMVTAGNHQGIADALNLPRATITVRRGVRTGIDVMTGIGLSDFEALVVARQQYILALVTPVEGVDLSNDVIRANLGTLFPVGSSTRTRLLAVADKNPASRAEQLWGVDTKISAQQVGAALALP